MIIIEGPDGSGKSTLITKLGYRRQAFKALRGGVGGAGVNGRQGWGTSPTGVVSYVRAVQKTLEEDLRCAPTTAFDRFHLSERVYGPILRQHQMLPDVDLELLNNYLRERQIPVILCLPPWKETLKNVSIEGRERPSYQTEAFLWMSYQRFEGLKPWATHVFDYTKDRIGDLPFAIDDTATEG